MSDQQEAPTPKRRFLPQPVEVITKVRRGVAAAPASEDNRVTSTQRTDEGAPNASPQEERKPRLGFAPPSVTTSTRSHRRFAPQPIESMTRNNRSKPETSSSVAIKGGGDAQASKAAKKGVGRRKFTPQLLETSSRSRKADDNGPNLSAADKTEVVPGTDPRSSRVKSVKSSLRAKAAEESRLIAEKVEVPPPSVVGPHLRRSRRPSFQIPNLESITSSESEPENCPSLSTSPSACSEHIADPRGPHSRTRESCDDRFSGYLLDLAARAAEKQLRDQAMAAFPNDEFHETVDHFANEQDSDVETSSNPSYQVRAENLEIGLSMSRTSSGDSVGWEVRQMRKHHPSKLFAHERLSSPSRSPASLLRRRSSRSNSSERRLPTAISTIATTAVRQASLSPFRALAIPLHMRETKFDHMRNAASPPMLGADLHFRTCVSPQSTRLDVDQFPGTTARRREEGGGLWMGFCTAADDALINRPSTPSHPARVDGIVTPESSPSSHLTSRRTSFDNALEADFPDSFVTQVYNYLSLGYPSLARKFDEELCKISQVPLEELSRHDHDPSALKRGFIELEDVGQSGGGSDLRDRGSSQSSDGNLPRRTIEKRRCARWKALRIYIREWARQNAGDGRGDFSQGALDSWGARARRGSWAV